MKTLKGPGIFLAQYIGDQAPFNSLENLAQWAAELGFKALQIPCNHPHIFNLATAADSQTYCDDVKGLLAQHGLTISELSTHLEGQLVAVHPRMTMPLTISHHRLIAAIRRLVKSGLLRQSSRQHRPLHVWGSTPTPHSLARWPGPILPPATA